MAQTLVTRLPAGPEREIAEAVVAELVAVLGNENPAQDSASFPRGPCRDIVSS